MKKCIIIYNGKSGNKYIDVDKFRSTFHQYSYEIEIIETKYPNHACKIMETLEVVDLVISAGGDGTYNEVITGNLKRDIPLLVANLPTGTTNDVASMYGYTKNVQKNIELLLNGIIKKVDVPTINNQVFTYVASFGSYMNIAYDTPRELKEKYGRLGYFIYGLKAIKDKLKLFDIIYEIDGKETSGKYSLIFVTNSTRIAGVEHLFKDVKLDDGMFEVVLCNLTSKQELVKNILLLPLMHVEDIPGFTVYRTNHFQMKIENIQDTSWCVDGEKLKDNAHFYNLIICKQMDVLIPRIYQDSLFEK